jgi:hypothetical protein
MCYNNNTVKGGSENLNRGRLKKFLKNFQKTLDKPHKVWYNKNVPKREYKIKN